MHPRRRRPCHRGTTERGAIQHSDVAMSPSRILGRRRPPLQPPPATTALPRLRVWEDDGDDGFGATWWAADIGTRTCLVCSADTRLPGDGAAPEIWSVSDTDGPRAATGSDRSRHDCCKGLTTGVESGDGPRLEEIVDESGDYFGYHQYRPCSSARGGLELELELRCLHMAAGLIHDFKLDSNSWVFASLLLSPRSAALLALCFPPLIPSFVFSRIIITPCSSSFFFLFLIFPVPYFSSLVFSGFSSVLVPAPSGRQDFGVGWSFSLLVSTIPRFKTWHKLREGHRHGGTKGEQKFFHKEEGMVVCGGEESC